LVDRIKGQLRRWAGLASSDYHRLSTVEDIPEAANRELGGNLSTVGQDELTISITESRL
jgi:hypothetical protein